MRCKTRFELSFVAKMKLQIKNQINHQLHHFYKTLFYRETSNLKWKYNCISKSNKHFSTYWSSIMSDNESSSSDRKRSPSLMRSNNDQGRSSKEVLPKVGEPLKEHPKRKRPKSRSKSSNDRSTDEEISSSPKRRSKKSKKRHRSRSKISKKKQRRY